jgi:hypothetical protein
MREETMSSVTEFAAPPRRSAVLDEAHIGHDWSLTVQVPTSQLTGLRGRRSQVWMPSMRELWCYAIILAASRDRKAFSGNDIVLATGAAPPPSDATRPVIPLSSKHHRGRPQAL